MCAILKRLGISAAKISSASVVIQQNADNSKVGSDQSLAAIMFGSFLDLLPSALLRTRQQ